MKHKLKLPPDKDFAELMIILGDSVKESGDLKSALQYFKQANTIFKLISPFQQTLCLSRISYIYQDLGDLQRALQFSEHNTNLIRKNITQNTFDHDIQHSLFMALLTTAHIYQRSQNYTQVLPTLQQSASILYKLTDLFPDNEEYQKSTIDLNEHLAYYYEITQQTERSFFHTNINYQLIKNLHQKNQEDVELIEQLGKFSEHMASIYLEQKNLTEALNYLVDAEIIFSHLCELRPNKIDIKQTLATVYMGIAELNLNYKDTDRAIIFYNKAFTIYEELYKNYPNIFNIIKNWGVCHQNLGQIYEDRNELNTSLAYFLDYNKLAIQLSNHYPNNVDANSLAAISHQYVGAIYFKLKEYDLAMEHYFNMLERFSLLCNIYPDNTEIKRGVGMSYQNIGKTFIQMDDRKNGEIAYQSMHQIFKELWESSPDNKIAKDEFAIVNKRMVEFYEEWKRSL